MKVINNSFERLSLTVRKTIGTLRSDNGDVHENVTEKQTSHPFILFAIITSRRVALKEGNLGWS